MHLRTLARVIATLIRHSVKYRSRAMPLLGIIDRMLDRAMTDA